MVTTSPTRLTLAAIVLSLVSFGAEAASPRCDVRLQRGRLSAEIVATPLADVLDRLAATTSAEIQWSAGRGTEPIDARFHDLPLADGIAQLLARRNYALTLARTADGRDVPRLWIGSPTTGTSWSRPSASQPEIIHAVSRNTSRHPGEVVDAPAEDDQDDEPGGSATANVSRGHVREVEVDRADRARLNLVKQLARSGSPDAESRLNELRENGDARMRADALVGLEMRDALSPDALASAALGADEPAVRMRAIELLGMRAVRQPDAIEVLRQVESNEQVAGLRDLARSFVERSEEARD